MPPKRGASDDSPTSTRSKIPKLEKPLGRDIVSKITRLRNIAGSKMGDSLCNRLIDDIVSRDDKIIQLKEEIMRLGSEHDVAQQKLTKCTALMKEATEKLNQALVKTNYPQDLTDALRQTTDEEQEDAQARVDHIAGARLLALVLANDIESWKEAIKNLRLAEAGDRTTGSDAGRADHPEGLPSYLLDREVAEKIVDHYEKRASKLVQDICKYLERPVVERNQDNV